MFHMYGLMIGVAVVAWWSITEYLEPKVNKILPWVLIFGFLGARIYHVVDLSDYYLRNLGQIVAVWNGGLGIWGGIIGGGVGLVIANHKFPNSQIEKWNILGAIVTGLPLAQAIGRVGNAVNGEFWDKVWILPWWSAEAILDLGLFGILWVLRGQSSQVKVGAYLVGYFLIRLVLNPFRADLR